MQKKIITYIIAMATAKQSIVQLYRMCFNDRIYNNKRRSLFEHYT